MAVHLEGQVVIDLPIDPGKYIGPDAVVSCAIGDPRHLVGVHGYWGLAMLVQVMETHLEGPNLQQRISCREGTLLLSEGVTLNQTHHRWLCATGQELGPRDGYFTKIGYLWEWDIHTYD